MKNTPTNTTNTTGGGVASSSLAIQPGMISINNTSGIK